MYFLKNLKKKNTFKIEGKWFRRRKHIFFSPAAGQETKRSSKTIDFRFLFKKIYIHEKVKKEHWERPHSIERLGQDTRLFLTFADADKENVTLVMVDANSKTPLWKAASINPYPGYFFPVLLKINSGGMG